MLKVIKVNDATGLKLAHDHTQIIPGKYKRARFQRGHIVRKSDILKLLDLGKKGVYVLIPSPGEMHEEDAARQIALAVAGRNLKLQAPQEGKVAFIANTFGLLKVTVGALEKINKVGAVILSTRHNHSIVHAGYVVAGTRVIPLLLREAKVARVEEIGPRHEPVIEVLPFHPKKVGILVTGSEILEGRIQDWSAGIIKNKVEALG